MTLRNGGNPTIGQVMPKVPHANQGKFPHHQGESGLPPVSPQRPVCCAVCGLQLATCLTAAHLDHNPGNNASDNLARLCPTHHWMYDAGLYPIEAIRLLQEHWQTVRGVPSHKARMKDAGAKAALTRKRKVAARKAVATRKSKEDAD
jgi:hypothetical protein